MKTFTKLHSTTVLIFLSSMMIGCSYSITGTELQMKKENQDHLTDENGMSYYSFDKDIKHSSESTCYGSCALQWPPVPANKSSGALFDKIIRNDGNEQLTHNGLPLYYFVGDVKAGDRNGNGLGGVWHLVKQGKTAKGNSDKGYNYNSNYSY